MERSDRSPKILCSGRVAVHMVKAWQKRPWTEVHHLETSATATREIIENLVATHDDAMLGRRTQRPVHFECHHR